MIKHFYTNVISTFFTFGQVYRGKCKLVFSRVFIIYISLLITKLDAFLATNHSKEYMYW
jgi:hypothetical protein